MNVYFVRYILGRKTRLIGESHWSPAPSSISQSRRGWWRCLVFPEIRSQGCSPAPVFNPLPVTAEYHCFRKDTTWYRKMVINLQRAKKKREIQIPSKGLQLSLSVLPGRSSTVDTHPISVSDFHGTKQSRHVVTEPTLFLFSLPRCALPVLCRQKQHQYLCRFQVAIQFTPLLIGEEKLEVTEKQVNKCQNSHYAPQHKLGNTILEGPRKQNALTSKHPRTTATPAH